MSSCYHQMSDYKEAVSVRLYITYLNTNDSVGSISICIYCHDE